MNMLYLVFGDEQLYYSQSYFSICTFLNQMDESDRIFVMTDSPDFYKRFEDRIEIILINQDQLIEWKGKHNYLFRTKIKAIQLISELHPDKPLLYLDSDTLLFADLKLLKEKLNYPVMHIREGALPELKSKTIKTLWQKIKGRKFGNIAIQNSHAMWNAGVVGIPAYKGSHTTNLALNICDEILEENVGKWVVEQLSFSIALSENGNLNPVDGFIGHYWSNKDEWNEAIQQFMLNSFLKNNTVQDDIDAISTFDFSKIAIQKRIPNTQIRLKKLISKWFPSENKGFIPQKT